MQKDTKDTALSPAEAQASDAKTSSEANKSVGALGRPQPAGSSLSFASMGSFPKLGDSAGFAKFKEQLKGDSA